VLLDNAMHESTGGQSTVSASVDFAGLAAACGYPHVHRCQSAEAMAEIFASRIPGLAFVHAQMAAGVAASLPRPTVLPQEVAQRLRSWIQNGGGGL
jgi:phosphonopyruvate decarboxylase